MRPVFLPKNDDLEAWDGFWKRIIAMLLVAFWILVGMSLRGLWELVAW